MFLGVFYGGIPRGILPSLKFFAKPAPIARKNMACKTAQAVRQIRIAMFNLEPLDTHPTLWGRTQEERWGAVDDVAQKLNEQLGKTALMTGAQFALRHIDESQKQPKAKCPFTPQREMIAKLWGANGPAKPIQPTLFD